jgi:transcription initiation factor IIE alpha subunit
VRDHGNKLPKRGKGNYWFEWWLACPGCHAIYHQESAKRYYANCQPSGESVLIRKFKRLIERKRREIEDLERQIADEQRKSGMAATA